MTTRKDTREPIELELVDRVEVNPEYLGKSDESFIHLEDDSVEETKHSWDRIRNEYVRGRIEYLPNGKAVHRYVTLKELAEKHGLAYITVRQKSSKGRWGVLRKAYVAKRRETGTDIDSLYDEQNFQTEVGTLTTCEKLIKVLDTYIDHRFGDILDREEDSRKGTQLDDDTLDRMNAINRNTGSAIFLNEVKDAIKVAKDIYGLNREIYENAPKSDIAKIEAEKNKAVFKNDKEREATVNRLEAMLSRMKHIDSSKDNSDEQLDESKVNY